MTSPRIARSRAGFTLTELLVALVLMAVSASLVLPMIGRSLNAGKISQASSVVVSALREAGAMAGRSRRPVRISVRPTQKVIYIRDHNRPDSIYRTLWLDGKTELALSQMTANDTQVVVFPNGLRTKPNSTDWPLWIRIGMGEEEREIRMTRAGQIRVITP